MVGEFVRTTIRLDDVLHAEVKLMAARDGKSISAFIEDSLRVTLATKGQAHPSPLKLHTVGGNGLIPGVHVDRSEDLLDVMETPDSLN